MKLSLPKIVAIGIYDSNIAARNKVVTKKRRTAMFEIEIPIGDGGISHINSDKAKITPDLIICAKPGQIRHTKLPFKCYYVHLIVTEGDLYDVLMSIPDYTITGNPEKYIGIYKKLCKYYETAAQADEIILHSLILKLIYILIGDSKKTELKNHIKGSNYETIEKIIKYINENLTSDLSLKSLSDYAGFSPIYFHNFFKSATGKTLRAYVENQRIKRAANMLVTTEYTLAEIAYECGFSSQSYFSFAFKRTMNKTPREYTKEFFERYERTI